MSRKRILTGFLLAALLAGCTTRLDRSRDPLPAAVAPVGAGSNAAPAREVALTADNTRISFVGAAGPTSHEGSFSRLKGRLELPTENPMDARLMVEIDMDSVYTKIDLLTKHLKRPDMFDVEKYPTATFVSRRIEAAKPGDARLLVTGDFTIHGTTRPVTFPARLTVTPDAATLEATFTILQTEFGMIESAKKTKDEVPVTVSIRVARR